MPVEIVDLDTIRAKARHHRRAGRITKGELVIGAIKPDPASRQPVNVRSPGHHIPVASESRGKVIYNDKKYVSRLRGNRRFATGRPGEEQGDEGGHGKQPSPESGSNKMGHAGYGLRLGDDLSLGLH